MRKFEYMDRVKDRAIPSLGFGDIWVINDDGTAFVQFGTRGPITVPLSSIEFVSKRVEV